MHGFLVLSMQPNTHISDKAACLVFKCHHHVQTGASQPVLHLESKFTSPPTQQIWRWPVFSLLRTNSAVKALVQVVKESSSTPPSALRECGISSPTFREVVLAFRLRQLSASPSQQSPPTPYGVFPSLLSQLRPRSSQERALDCEEEGRPEVQSLLKLKAQCCCNTLANEGLKKGRALKWGAKAVSKLLEQLLIEVMNKVFSLAAFTGSEESIFPLSQFLHFSLVNDLFIRNEKLITG